MRFRINGRTVIQHFGVTMDSDGKQVRLSLLIASRWTGTLMLDGKQTPVTVVDDNTDGVISSGDMILLGEHEWRRLPIAGRIMLNGQLWRFQVAATGERLTLEPIETPKGQIRFSGERVLVTLEGDDGVWILEGQDGTVPAPVSEFRIIEVEITRKDKQGRFWVLSAYASGPAAPKMRITEEGAPLNLEPLKISLVWDRKGNEFEFSLDLKTSNGMSVRDLVVNNRRPPEPKLRLTAPNGKVISEPKFHYG